MVLNNVYIWNDSELPPSFPQDAAEQEKSTNLSTGFVAAFEAEVQEAYIEGQGEEVR